MNLYTPSQIFTNSFHVKQMIILKTFEIERERSLCSSFLIFWLTIVSKIIIFTLLSWQNRQIAVISVSAIRHWFLIWKIQLARCVSLSLYIYLLCYLIIYSLYQSQELSSLLVLPKLQSCNIWSKIHKLFAVSSNCYHCSYCKIPTKSNQEAPIMFILFGWC